MASYSFHLTPSRGDLVGFAKELLSKEYAENFDCSVLRTYCRRLPYSASEAV